MNETGESLFNLDLQILVLETAVVLAIIVAVIWFLAYRKRKMKKSFSRDFLNDVKGKEDSRELELNEKIKKITSLEDEQIQVIVEKLVVAEKTACVHIAQLYMGYKPESLQDLESEMSNISKNYIDIIDNVSSNGGAESTTEGGGDDDSAMRELKKQVTNLREEKKSLKLKNAQLQIDFEASVDSIERMTTEFANMYEGGSKDGEKRIKNEMYQLRQILAKKMDATSVDGDFDADLTIDEIPDMDVDSDSAGQIDEEKPDEAAAK